MSESDGDSSSFNSVQSLVETFDLDGNQDEIQLLVISVGDQIEDKRKYFCNDLSLYGLVDTVDVDIKEYDIYFEGAKAVLFFLNHSTLDNEEGIKEMIDIGNKCDTVKVLYVVCDTESLSGSEVVTHLSTAYDIILNDLNTFLLSAKEPLYAHAIHEIIKQIDISRLNFLKIKQDITTLSVENLPPLDNLTLDTMEYEKLMNEIVGFQGQLVFVESSQKLKLALIYSLIEKIKLEESRYFCFEFSSGCLTTNYLLIHLINNLKSMFIKNNKVLAFIVEQIEDFKLPQDNLVLTNALNNILEKLGCKILLLLHGIEKISSIELTYLIPILSKLANHLTIVVYSASNKRFASYSEQENTTYFSITETKDKPDNKGLLAKLETVLDNAELIKLVQLLSMMEYVDVRAIKQMIDTSKFYSLLEILRHFFLIDEKANVLVSNSKVLTKTLKHTNKLEILEALISNNDIPGEQVIGFILNNIHYEELLLQLFHTSNFVFKFLNNKALLRQLKNCVKNLYYDTDVSIEVVDYIYTLYKTLELSSHYCFDTEPASFIAKLQHFAKFTDFYSDVADTRIKLKDSQRGQASIYASHDFTLLQHHNRLIFLNHKGEIISDTSTDNEITYFLKLSDSNSELLKVVCNNSTKINLKVSDGNEIEMNLHKFVRSPIEYIETIEYCEQERLLVLKIGLNIFVFDISFLIKNQKFTSAEDYLVSHFEANEEIFINSCFTKNAMFAYSVSHDNSLNLYDVTGAVIDIFELPDVIIKYGVLISTSITFKLKSDLMICFGLSDGNICVLDLNKKKFKFCAKIHDYGVTKLNISTIDNSYYLVSSGRDSRMKFTNVDTADNNKSICFSSYGIVDFGIVVLEHMVKVWFFDTSNTLYSCSFFAFELLLNRLQKSQAFNSSSYWNGKDNIRVSNLVSKKNKDEMNHFREALNRFYCPPTQLKLDLKLFFNSFTSSVKDIKAASKQNLMRRRRRSSAARRRRSTMAAKSKIKREGLGIFGVGIKKQKNKPPLSQFQAEKPVACLSVMDHTGIIASCHETSSIYVISPKHRRLLDVNLDSETSGYLAHKDYVTVVVFSKNGKYLASGCDNGIVCLWNCNKEFQLVSKYSHNDGVTSLAFDDHASYLASGSKDHIIKLWTLKSDENLRLQEDAVERFLNSLPGTKVSTGEQKALTRHNRRSKKRNYRRRTEEIDFRRKKNRHKRISAISRKRRSERIKVQLIKDDRAARNRQYHILSSDAELKGPLNTCLTFQDFHGVPSSISFNTKLNLFAGCCTSHFGALKVWRIKHSKTDFASVVEVIDKPALGDQFPVLVFFSDDGKYMVCGCEQTTRVESSHLVVIYELRYTKKKLIFRRARALYVPGFPNYTYLGMSLNSKFIAESLKNQKVRYWHIASGKEVIPEIPQKLRRESVLSLITVKKMKDFRGSSRGSKHSLETTATKTTEPLLLSQTTFQYHSQASVTMALQAYPSTKYIQDGYYFVPDVKDSTSSFMLEDNGQPTDRTFVVDTVGGDSSVIVNNKNIYIIDS